MKNLDHINLVWPRLFVRLSRSRTCEVGSQFVVKRARYIIPHIRLVVSSESKRVYHTLINMNVNYLSKLFAMHGHIVALGKADGLPICQSYIQLRSGSQLSDCCDQGG
jgi:hypothetical protein